MNKKRLMVMLLLCVCAFTFSLAQAKPAPNLSSVQITHVGADHSGWIPVSKIPETTLQGQQFYIAIQFTGYPNPNLISLYQNGHLIQKSEITEPFGRKGIGKPYVTGWVYQFAMPISYGNGAIAVQAEGINGGRRYNTIYNVKSQYQP